MDPILVLLLSILISAVSLGCGVKIGHMLGRAGKPISLTPEGTTPARPQVVINIPTDFKPIDPIVIDGKPTLMGPRALLFYAVYDRAINAFTFDGGTHLDESEELAAYESAKMAVKHVYGETFDT